VGCWDLLLVSISSPLGLIFTHTQSAVESLSISDIVNKVHKNYYPHMLKGYHIFYLPSGLFSMTHCYGVGGQ